MGIAAVAVVVAWAVAGSLGVLTAGERDARIAGSGTLVGALAGSGDVSLPAAGDRAQVAPAAEGWEMRCPSGDDCVPWQVRLPSDGPELPEVVVAGDRMVAVAGGQLSAHSLDDGRWLWSTRTWADGAPLRPEGTPIVVDDLVLVRDELGVLRALALATGDAVWTAAVGPVGRLDGAHRYGDVVVVVTVRGPDADPAQVAVAIERDTGEVRWRRTGDRLLLADRWPVLLQDGEVVGLDPHRGTDVWRRTMRGATTEATAAGSVIAVVTAARSGVPSFAEVIAAADGRLLRAVRVQPGSLPAAARVAAPLLLGDGAQVSLVEADGGGWTAPTPEGRCCAGQAVADDHVVVQLTRDRLLTLDRRDGRRLSVAAIQHVAEWADLGTVHGLLRFRVSDDGGRLVGYSLAEGKPLVDLPRTAIQPVPADGGTVLLVHRDGVVALRTVTTERDDD